MSDIHHGVPCPTCDAKRGAPCTPHDLVRLRDGRCHGPRIDRAEQDAETLSRFLAEMKR